MRITREKVFDLIELIGNAIANARYKPVVVTLKTDDWGLFEGAQWRDRVTPSEILGFAEPGQDWGEECRKTAAYFLRGIQMDLENRTLTVRDAMEELRTFCRHWSVFLSKGWASQITRLIG